MITVLIADDHPVVRKGLKLILTEHSDIAVAGEVSSVAALLDYLGRSVPDVVVLDVNMPGRSGIEAIGDIRRACPRLPILILSVHPEDQLAVRALAAGAAGYLNKDSAPDRLVEAVRKLHGGGKYISDTLAATLVEHLQRPQERREPHELLSEREYTVLLMIASGKTVSAIGEELGLSVKTISTYRARILEKMELSTNAELTRYVIERSLG